MITCEVAIAAHDELGEGPWWSVAEQVLWRVDILRNRVHRSDPVTGEADEWEFDGPVGFVVPDENGRVVVGTGTALQVVDLATGERWELAVAEPGRSDLRFNDGKSDRSGRIWAGTMSDDDAPPGQFYRFDAESGMVPMLDGIVCSNGLGWSPDGTTMYYTDSGPRTIWAFDFDDAAGAISDRRVFAIDDDCFPDGLTVDAEGGVWSAKWGGGRVVRYAPNGTISDTVATAASQPTSCVFGGPDLEVLYVTTASVGLDAEEVAATPAGSVLAVSPGVRGLPEIPVQAAITRLGEIPR